MVAQLQLEKICLNYAEITDNFSDVDVLLSAMC